MVLSGVWRWSVLKWVVVEVSTVHGGIIGTGRKKMSMSLRKKNIIIYIIFNYFETFYNV